LLLDKFANLFIRLCATLIFCAIVWNELKFGRLNAVFCLENQVVLRDPSSFFLIEAPTIHTILKNNGYLTHFIKKQFKDFLHFNQKDKTFLEGKQSEKRDEKNSYP
jgi:hypothetical protein